MYLGAYFEICELKFRVAGDVIEVEGAYFFDGTLVQLDLPLESSLHPRHS